MIARMPTDLTIRPDLVAAQAEAWRHVTSPGGSWTGFERAAMAELALAALDDEDPIARGSRRRRPAGRPPPRRPACLRWSSMPCTASLAMRRR